MVMAKKSSKQKVGLWLDPRWNQPLTQMSDHMGLSKGDIAAAAISLFISATHDQRRQALQEVIGQRFDEVAEQAEEAAQQAKSDAQRRRQVPPDNPWSSGETGS